MTETLEQRLARRRAEKEQSVSLQAATAESDLERRLRERLRHKLLPEPPEGVEIPEGEAPAYEYLPLGEAARRAAGAFGAGVARGTGAIAALPPRLLETRSGISQASRLLGMGEPVSRRIGAGAERLAGAIEPEEPTGEEQVLTILGEEMAASAAVGGPILAAARRGVQIGGPIVKRAFQAAARQPAQFVAEEAAGVVGATAGRAGAEPGTTREAVGGVAGGLSPGMARAVGRMAHLGGRAFRAWRGAVSPSRAEKRAAEILQLNVTNRDRALAEMDQIEAIRAEYGVEPSLFAATRDPGIRELEIELIRRPEPESGVNALTFEQARERGNQALRRRFIEYGPPPGSSVEHARAAASLAVQRRLDAIEEELRRSGAFTDPDELAVAQRGRILEAAEAWRQEMRVGFDALDEDAARFGILIPDAPLRRANARIRKAAGKFDVLPEGLMKEIDSLPAEISFRDLRSLRRRLNAEIRSAYSRMGGTAESASREQLKWLGMLREGVQESLDQLMLPSTGAVSIERRKALAALRRANPDQAILQPIADEYARLYGAFSEGARRYREGLTGIVTDVRGRVQPSETLGLYFRKGKGAPEAAQEFNVKFDDPESQRTMVEYIVHRAYAASADANGVPVAQRLGRFLKNHTAALKEFPDARTRIDRVEKLTREAEALGIRAPRSAEAVGRGALALFMDDPHAAVKAVLRSNDPAEGMRRLIGELGGDRQAVDGLRRVFWDLAEDEVLTNEPLFFGTFQQLADPSGRPMLVSGPALRPFVDRHQEAIAVLFSPSHPGNLRRLAAVADVNARIPTLTPGKIREEGRSVPAELERSGAFAMIASVPRRAFRVVTRGRGMVEKLETPAAEVVLREALANPQLARTLLLKNTPASRAAVRRILSTNIPTLPWRVEQRAESEKQQSGVAAGGRTP